MAGDWLKMEKSLPDKPEAWAIADKLGIDPDAVVGKLLRVWSWFDDQTESGNAPSVTRSLLDRRVGVPGFCDAMIESGWMHDDGAYVSLPNFERHNGKTAKKRALTAKRVADHKKKGNAESNAPGNADSVTAALPREEKRRDSSAARAPARESDPDAEQPTTAEDGDGLSYREILSVLDAHGMPYQFAMRDDARRQITAWSDAGVTSADLAEAWARGHAHKRDGPIGPGYLDPIVKQVVAERLNPQRANHGTNNSGHHRPGSSADYFDDILAQC